MTMTTSGLWNERGKREEQEAGVGLRRRRRRRHQSQWLRVDRRPPPSNHHGRAYRRVRFWPWRLSGERSRLPRRPCPLSPRTPIAEQEEQGMRYGDRLCRTIIIYYNSTHFRCAGVSTTTTTTTTTYGRSDCTLGRRWTRGAASSTTVFNAGCYTHAAPAIDPQRH